MMSITDMQIITFLGRILHEFPKSVRSILEKYIFLKWESPKKEMICISVIDITCSDEITD
jgi:hypothetical protein